MVLASVGGFQTMTWGGVHPSEGIFKTGVQGKEPCVVGTEICR